MQRGALTAHPADARAVFSATQRRRALFEAAFFAGRVAFLVFAGLAALAPRAGFPAAFLVAFFAGTFFAAAATDRKSTSSTGHVAPTCAC